ncbi:hypothetical protein RB201_31215 [Streptomyces sp. S1A(2023)]
MELWSGGAVELWSCGAVELWKWGGYALTSAVERCCGPTGAGTVSYGQYGWYGQYKEYGSAGRNREERVLRGGAVSLGAR